MVFVATDLTRALYRFRLRLISSEVKVRARIIRLINRRLGVIEVTVASTSGNVATVRIRVFLALIIPCLAILAFCCVGVRGEVCIMGFRIGSVFWRERLVRLSCCGLFFVVRRQVVFRPFFQVLLSGVLVT